MGPPALTDSFQKLLRFWAGSRSRILQEEQDLVGGFHTVGGFPNVGERLGPLLLSLSVWWLVNPKAALSVFSPRTPRAEMTAFAMLTHPSVNNPAVPPAVHRARDITTGGKTTFPHASNRTERRCFHPCAYNGDATVPAAVFDPPLRTLIEKHLFSQITVWFTNSNQHFWKLSHFPLCPLDRRPCQQIP